MIHFIRETTLKILTMSSVGNNKQQLIRGGKSVSVHIYSKSGLIWGHYKGHINADIVPLCILQPSRQKSCIRVALLKVVAHV